MSKLIINVKFSKNINFKIAFDTSGDKKFRDLKATCIERLQKFAQVAPENMKDEIPASFNIQDYQLQDEKNFAYDDSDLVADLCQNNEIVLLIHLAQILQPQAQPLPANPTPVISTTPPPSQPLLQPVPQTFTGVQPPAPTPPASLNQPFQATNLPSMMKPEEIDTLKQSFYLNVDPLKNTQQLGGNFEFFLKFLQAEDKEFPHSFICQSDMTLFDLSVQVCQALKLIPEQHTLSLYTENGQGIYAWLNQMHLFTVEDTLSKMATRTFLAIITRCQPGAKSHPKLDSDGGVDQVFILHNGPKVIRANVETDTVIMLKQRVYHKLNIPTNLQQLYYAGKCMQDENLIKDYNVQNNSNIQLSFKMQQIVGYAESYSFNFFSPWMEHFVKQNDEGNRSFRAHSLVFFRHHSDVNVQAMIRLLSKNNTALMNSVASLCKNRRLSQMQKIALEEGMMRLFFDMIISTQQVPNPFNAFQIFEHTRKCYAFILEQSKKIVKDMAKHSLQENYRSLDLNCQITLAKIAKVALLQPKKDCEDTSLWNIVCEDKIREKIEKNEANANGDLFSELQMVSPAWLKEEFEILKIVEKDTIIWQPKSPFVQAELIEAFYPNWHTKSDDFTTGPLSIHSAVQLKSHPPTPCLTRNQNKALVIYTSMNKDVKKPVNLFDPMTGVEQPENPDDMAYQQVRVMTGASSAAVDSGDEDEDDIKVVTQVTVPPDEAIVVILDISGSMDEDFYESDDLTRLGVVKAFFNAYADRTMAYNLKNVISLVFFDDRYILKCGFTELFMQFKELVNKAKSKGTTALYTALQLAAQSLVEFKKKYPDTMLRIIALTDGEDNRSKHKPQDVANYIVKNRIILDSFVVYDKCNSLKQITMATGGKCFCPKSIQEGLRLFEYETILTAKCRKDQKYTTAAEVKKAFQMDPKDIPFDEQPYEIVLPNQLNDQSINPRNLVQQISADQKQLQLYAPNATLKRVIKEIMDYEAKPHPFIKVFPCQNDVSFWKILMLGPEQTPYLGGAYILYMKFPNEYPNKPPELRFLTPIYHCNINAQGRICHSVLDRNYSADLRVLQIFQQIYGLLMTPEPDDPLDTTIASEYIQDLETYRKKATAHTQKYAQKPLDEVMKQILGKDGNECALSDVELQLKINEINTWMGSSQATKPPE